MVTTRKTESFFNRYLPALEAEMRIIVRESEAPSGNLSGMLQYHLGWVDAAFGPCQASSGKRIRPVLCLLSCEACDGNWRQALPAAAAIELLHNFSLIHDDIEDQDELRRGRPTVWTLWGEPQAINAGDAMFTLAQLALLQLVERDVPAATVVKAAQLFNQTCLALTQGQHLDLGFEEAQEAITVEDYLTMIEGKTAALVACACEMGALVTEAPTAQREHLHDFGRHLGLAFQMQDDVLGIAGEPDVTGKPVGSDVARGKKTLPIIHGLAHSAELRALLEQELLSDDDVHRATHLLEAAGSIDYTKQLAREHHEHSLAALEQLPEGSATQALHTLAQALLDRER